MAKNKTGMMEIAFSNGIVNANAKSGMVNLKDIEKMGMNMAGIETANLYGKRLSRWIELEDTKEFINELTNKSIKDGNLSQEFYVQTGRGRYSKAWGHLYLALKYAMYINKQLEVEVLETFIEKKILDLRILGIESFKELNHIIDTLEDVQQIDPKYRYKIYSSIATSVNRRCNGQFIPEWDHQNANADIQKLRKDILESSITSINNGFIKNSRELKAFIDNFVARRF